MSTVSDARYGPRPIDEAKRLARAMMRAFHTPNSSTPSNMLILGREGENTGQRGRAEGRPQEVLIGDATR